MRVSQQARRRPCHSSPSRWPSPSRLLLLPEGEAHGPKRSSIVAAVTLMRPDHQTSPPPARAFERMLQRSGGRKDAAAAELRRELLERQDGEGGEARRTRHDAARLCATPLDQPDSTRYDDFRPAPPTPTPPKPSTRQTEQVPRALPGFLSSGKCMPPHDGCAVACTIVGATDPKRPSEALTH